MIDLHVHTNISDNSLSAEEILALARKRGITHLALTNHDTTKGLAEAMEQGQEMGVQVIPGIEISAFDYQRDRRAHILGLYIEPGHPALEKLCAPLVRRRREASEKMVEKIAAAGFDLCWEDAEKYAGGTGVFKQHIMHALLEKGYCEHIYGELYQKLFRRSGSPVGIAYVPIEYADAAEAIRAVREAGGIAVLAHPGQMDNFAAIDHWAELGLQGIEVFHPSHSPEDRQLAWQYAQKHQLVVTGGSDHHGFYGEMPVELGCPELGEACIARLLAIKERH